MVKLKDFSILLGLLSDCSRQTAGTMLLKLFLFGFFLLVKAELKNKGGFYAYIVQNVDGEDISLEKYRNKISLVVNVASECGYTDIHYEQLVALYNQLTVNERQPFTVLAFPCNQFGQQEPYSSDKVLQHVQSTYGVPFPVFGKLEVIGTNAHPAFTFLARNSANAPDWNFWKYLVDENGVVIGSWGPRVNVDELKEDIFKALNELKKKHNEL